MNLLERIERLERQAPRRHGDLRESFPRLAKVWSPAIADVLADYLLEIATVADEIVGLEPAEALAAVDIGSRELAAQLAIDPQFKPDALITDPGDEWDSPLPTLTAAGRAFFGRFGTTMKDIST